MTTTNITFANAPDPDRLYKAWAEIETRNGEPGHNGATAGNSTESPCTGKAKRSSDMRRQGEEKLRGQRNAMAGH